MNRSYKIGKVLFLGMLLVGVIGLLMMPACAQGQTFGGLTLSNPTLTGLTTNAIALTSDYIDCRSVKTLNVFVTMKASNTVDGTITIAWAGNPDPDRSSTNWTGWNDSAWRMVCNVTGNTNLVTSKTFDVSAIQWFKPVAYWNTNAYNGTNLAIKYFIK